jgi:hypothetical protein
MKALLTISTLVAIALAGSNEYSLYAQEDSAEVELQLIQEIEKLEEQELKKEELELDEEKIEAWIVENTDELEQWAEEHAQSWEEWGERFGEKMERWAEENEQKWESWAEDYSQRWEEWGAKLESGEFGDEDMGILIERNLEMLKEMPLDTLIEGALHEGLGELKNAPFESLGELHELIGGALEQSLRNMEKEIAGATESDLKKKLHGLQTGDLRVTLTKLQDAIDAKHKKHDHDATDKLAKLKTFLEKNSDLSEETKADILAALKKEFAESNARSRLPKKEKAKLARLLAKEKAKFKQDLNKEEAARYQALQRAAEAKKAEYLKLQQQDMMATQKDLETSQRALKRHYHELEREKAELSTKESEIDAMRREIAKLRKEVERMKKRKQKDED